MGTADLSGATWWRANQGKFPNSREIDDLESGFRTNVERFVNALKQAGAAVVVSSTLRNPIRAHLMHYSWKVAYRRVDPKDVPSCPGLDIDWDHGDIDKSRAGALDMVKLFGMAHIASLTSNHIKGKAIDMNINWKDTLQLPLPATYIDSLPRTGQNKDLHEIGYKVYGVRKLVTDPPHWSYNGK